MEPYDLTHHSFSEKARNDAAAAAEMIGLRGETAIEVPAPAEIETAHDDS